VNTVLRRRGATSHVVVSLASSLVGRRDRYFDALGAYRDGDQKRIISGFAAATTIAASESRVSAALLAGAPEEMRDMVGSVRGHSATAKLPASFPSAPMLTAEDASVATGASTANVCEAIGRLKGAGVPRPLIARNRNQIWGRPSSSTNSRTLGSGSTRSRADRPGHRRVQPEG
jgi:hypothetical protein